MTTSSGSPPEILYYFTGPEFGLDNLVNQRLKLSFADQVNDLDEFEPFDFKDRSNRNDWRQEIKNRAKREGFISLSETWHVPTMWAHYARNSTGLCYGFEFSPKVGADENPVKVDYISERITPPPEKISDLNAWTTARKTKSKHWEYEREWRIFVNLNKKEESLRSCGYGGPIFRRFDEIGLSLKKVIIGCAASFTSQQVNLVAPNVNVITARRAFRSFSIVEQRNPKKQS